MIVASYNVEKAADFLQIGTLLARLLRAAPPAVAEVSAFVSSKWVFGLCTFILGMSLADRLVRASQRIEGEASIWSDLLLTYKKFMIIRALRGTPPFARVIDLTYELQTLDAALRRPHRNMPPLPCTDIANVDGMLLTRRYLEVVGSLRGRHIEEARVRATAMIAATRPAAPPVARLSWQRRARLAALALLGV